MGRTSVEFEVCCIFSDFFQTSCGLVKMAYETRIGAARGLCMHGNREGRDRKTICPLSYAMGRVSDDKPSLENRLTIS